MTGNKASPLVERWYGRINAWGLQAAPKPAGATDAGFAGCPVRTDGCASPSETPFAPIPFVGTPRLTLAERRVGSSWSVMPTPNQTPPPQAQSNSELDGVSCPGRRACHAVGDGYGVDRSELSRDRRALRRSELAARVNAEHRRVRHPLTGVSCPSRLFCMAVGGTGDFQPPRTLAAQWTP